LKLRIKKREEGHRKEADTGKRGHGDTGKIKKQ
jgi:hypothetical protein